MNELQTLIAIEDIKRLKARYFRAMDGKQWEALRDVFCADVSCDYRGGATDPATGFNAIPGATEAVIEGAEAAIEALQSGLGSLVSIHLGHSPEIEIISASSATGIWGMSDSLRFPAGSPLRRLNGYGHYYDTYERGGAGWRIKSIRLTRLAVDITAAADDGLVRRG